jgi:hypothetical protein
VWRLVLCVEGTRETLIYCPSKRAAEIERREWRYVNAGLGDYPLRLAVERVPVGREA